MSHLDHVAISTADYPTSLAFYEAALAPLGIKTHMKFEGDEGNVAGPAAGLLAAWIRHPGHALLVLAADLARVTPALLDQLVTGRRADGRIATAFRHRNGIPEPLCAIWEPAAAAAIRGARSPNAPSLRRLLEAADAELLEPQWPGQLDSINTPEELAALRDAV